VLLAGMMQLLLQLLYRRLLRSQAGVLRGFGI
jgi:hypothetical protein